MTFRCRSVSRPLFLWTGHVGFGAAQRIIIIRWVSARAHSSSFQTGNAAVFLGLFSITRNGRRQVGT